MILVCIPTIVKTDTYYYIGSQRKQIFNGFNFITLLYYCVQFKLITVFILFTAIIYYVRRNIFIMLRVQIQFYSVYITIFSFDDIFYNL